VAWQVQLLQIAAKDLKKLDRQVARRIGRRLGWLGASFDQIDPEPLKAGIPGSTSAASRATPQPLLAGQRLRHLPAHRPRLALGPLETHPLRGLLFETWVLGEIAKAHLHRGRRPRVFFYREQNRLEIDLLLEKGADLTVIEIKSARTPSGRHFAAFDRLAKTLEGRDAPGISDRIVIYGGDETQARSAGTLLSWRDLDNRDWFGH